MNLFSQRKDIFIHVGPSMNPTLRAADIVKVAPYNGNKIQPGDVIVFRSKNKKINISHRVVKVENGSIFTQGDNNSQLDNFIVKPQEIIGKVIIADRGKRQLNIYGGIQGQIFAFWVRWLRLTKKTAFIMLRPFYRIAASLSPLKLTPQIFIFGDEKYYMILGRKVIGRLRSGKRKWQIYPPYRIFVKEPALSACDAKN